MGRGEEGGGGGAVLGAGGERRSTGRRQDGTRDRVALEESPPEAAMDGEGRRGRAAEEPREREI